MVKRRFDRSIIDPALNLKYTSARNRLSKTEGSRKLRPNNLLWMVLLLLLVTWLGARGIDADPIWIDEYWSVYNAGGGQYGPLSPVEILNRIAEEDNPHSPLYYLLLAGWGQLAGWSHAAMRYLSVIFGVLSVALAYRMGRDIHSPLAGLGAAVAIGASTFHVYYFHELRNYTMTVFFAVLILWSYWRSIHGGSRLMMAVFTLSVAGAMYTIYLLVPLLLAVGLYHLIVVRKDRRWFVMTGLVLLAGVLFLPWVYFVAIQALQDITQPESVSNRLARVDLVQNYPQLLYLFANGAVALPLLAGLIMLRNTAFTRFTQGRYNPRVFVWFVLAVLLVLVLVINLLIQLFIQPRYLLLMWPVLALVVGIGVVDLRQHRLAGLFLSLWVVGTLWTTFDVNYMRPYVFQPILSHTPWHRIVPSLEQRMQPDDTAAFLLPDETWWVWQDWVSGFYLVDLQNAGLDRRLVQSYPYFMDRDYRQEAREINAPRVWIGYHRDDPPMAWWRYDETLLAAYVPCAAPIVVDDYQLDLYQRIPAEPELNFEDGAGIRLIELVQSETAITPVIGIAIGEALGSPQDYSIGLHVVDPAGTLVTQADFGLIDSGQVFVPYRCTAETIAVEQLPAGPYTLMALIYNWQTGERFGERQKLMEFVVE
jgi:hypothetical protein